MTALENWKALAKKLQSACEDVFKSPQRRNTNLDATDPSVQGMALLARTMSNVHAVEIMIEHYQITEARTLARCCYENMFFAAALAKEGNKFVERMLYDESHRTVKQGKEYLKWAKEQDVSYDFETTLREAIEKFEEQGSKLSTTTIKSASVLGDIEQAYLTYSELSHDAAHPSILSLQRHMRLDESGGIYIFANPQTDDIEIARTMGLACTGLLSVYSSISSIVQHKKAFELIRVFAEECGTIQDLTEV